MSWAASSGAAALLVLAGCATAPPPERDGSGRYERCAVEGWTVWVRVDLLEGGPQAPLGKDGLRLLRNRLEEIVIRIPERPVTELRKVPIWLGVDDGPNERAQYHPSAEWLRKNGFDPAKAKAVEIGSASTFLKTWRQQPQVILHELAHAYHDRVLGFDHAGIREAFAMARKEGRYEAVLRGGGTLDRHYALTDPQEYFAEGTEAYFGANDFYPFVRAELLHHDPLLYRILEQVW